MRTLRGENKGYITIEMCLVMPVVIGIIMMLVMLILKAGNEGMALGLSQLVTYNISDDSFKQEELWSLSEQLRLNNMVGFDNLSGTAKLSENELRVMVKSSKEANDYSISPVECVREWNMCTDRLRRWQLYGDVLCE